MIKPFLRLVRISSVFVLIVSVLWIQAPGHNIASAESFYVVLDPGHGGTDNGAPSVALANSCGIPLDVHEKDINLDISLRVRDLLQAQGVRVSLTRDTDIFIDINPRTAFINQEMPDLAVSIHTNSGTYNPTTGAYSCGDGVEALYSSIGPNWSGPNPNLEASKQLARRLASQIHETFNLRLRYPEGIYDTAGNIGLVRDPQVPSALIEMAFVSNSTELELMRDRADDFAQAIASAILDQLGIVDRNETKVTDIPNPDTYTCSQAGHVDFEGLPDETNLSSGTIAGMQFTTTNGYSWLVGDFATGEYNGKYPNGAYTSQGTHWAWLGETQGAGRIDFPKGPASYFSLLVSNNTPVYIDAYNTNGEKLATAGPSQSNLFTGHMTELKISRATVDIAYVMVHDEGNFFEIDSVCTNAPGTPNTIRRIVDETYFMETGDHSFGSFWVDFVAGTRRFLHIFIGPFFSDVDLVLTRPNGTIVSVNDPGVTFNKTANFIEVTIDGASAGDWQYEIIANELEPGGEAIRIVVDEESILQGPTFDDVSQVYWAWEFVERLYGAQITGGCNLSPLRYCPETSVTRAQMAVFLLRGIHGASYMPPGVGNNTGYGDVPTTYWAAAWIKQLAAEGITGGCGTNLYCPEAPVTRAQMAVFLLRSMYGASYNPPAVGSSTGFTDVPADYWAGAWIKQLIAESITSGCGTGAYCPEQPVTRAEMAVFLVRTFNLP